MENWIYETLAKIGYVHPLHPVSGHLPLGLVMAAFLFGLFALLFRRPHFFETVRHCFILAIIAWFPTVISGYLDWQYRLQGQSLHPIVMKLILSGPLLIFLCIPVVFGFKHRKLVMISCILSLVTATGIGFYGAELVYKKETPVRGKETGIVARGASIFTQRCSSCHLSDSTEKKVAVGLKRLFKRRKLPASGRSATEKNIRELLKNHINGKSPLEGLKDYEVDALMAYLKTL
jgi:uncharacterized membrane protein